jgi:hypothetical protein
LDTHRNLYLETASGSAASSFRRREVKATSRASFWDRKKKDPSEFLHTLPTWELKNLMEKRGYKVQKKKNNKFAKCSLNCNA